MLMEMPYFMEDDEWTYYDEEAGMLKLTDKATKKARESYERFYSSRVGEETMKAREAEENEHSSNSET